MRALLLYAILATISISFGQTKEKLDSLLHVKLTNTGDTVAVKHYIKLAYAYRKPNFDSALHWVNKAIALSKELPYDRFKIMSLHSKGYLYKAHGDNKIAVDTLLAVLQLSRESEERTSLATINQDLGVLYRILGNFDKSIERFLEAVKESERKQNRKSIFNSYNSLANTYSQLGINKKSARDLERANGYYKKAIKYIDSSEKSLMGMVVGNQGVTYFNIGKLNYDSTALKKANELYFKSLKLREAVKDSNGISQCYGNIAGVYHELCNLKMNEAYLMLAAKNYEKALEIDRLLNYEYTYSDLGNYGGHLALIGNYKKDKAYIFKAIEHLKLSLVEGEKKGDILNSMYMHENLSHCYQSLKDFETANYHLRRFINLKDTILSEENKQIAEDLAMKYESDLKDAENNSLKNEALLREEVISKKSTTINVMIIGSVLMLGLIILVMISRQKITKAKRLTEKQKLIIEEKNKEITDSINYAKRLQNTMLPDQSSLGAVFEDSFIFYRPKDIVSGDFYWYTSDGNNKIVTAVDCTGHGVPGAFMSMLGITFLNEIVGQKNIYTPNLILGELRDRVKSTLKQKGIEGEARDGMDIALVNIDREHSKLQFSGANNPIWIFRGQEIIEVNPDKRPIGYFKGLGLPFTNHSIELKKGDCVYLFTDGYADQFGGPRGKKFKYKTLSDLLSRINQKPCSEQKEILEKTFIDWKGNLDQIDDVLVIGIKI